MTEETQKETTEDLEPIRDLVVVARNPEEMQKAQTQLTSWADGKLKEATQTMKEFEENYEIAKKNKWRTELLKRSASLAKKRVEYYEKMKSAFQEGYCLIPELPVDVFAIRTTKRKPKANLRGNSLWGVAGQHTNAPALGAGRYVNQEAEVWHQEVPVTTKEGKPDIITQHWSQKFVDVDFPFSAVKPEVMNDTARAMALKIFDDFGILPARRKKGDPMVIGRIHLQEGNRKKITSFLVTWFVNTKDL